MPNSNFITLYYYDYSLYNQLEHIIRRVWTRTLILNNNLKTGFYTGTPPLSLSRKSFLMSISSSNSKLLELMNCNQLPIRRLYWVSKVPNLDFYLLNEIHLFYFRYSYKGVKKISKIPLYMQYSDFIILA